VVTLGKDISRGTNNWSGLFDFSLPPMSKQTSSHDRLFHGTGRMTTGLAGCHTSHFASKVSSLKITVCILFKLNKDDL
jgi:hypothetical protein